MAKLINRLD